MRLVVLLVLLVAVVVAQTAAQEACVTIEGFKHSKVGAFPEGWKLRAEEGREVYTVQEENGRRFLRAIARGHGVQAARPYEEWDLTTHPVLAWSWRPREFPKGADERQPATNDSALAVYMLVPHSKVRGPKAVKYIWSEKVPVGTRLESNNGLTHVRVLRSGAPAAKGWVDERVNVLRDFQASFKDEGDTPRPAGIAVLTDADDTKSAAHGEYANFRACKS